MALNTSDPHGAEPSAGGPLGLYGLFWRFSGDACVVSPDIGNLARGEPSPGLLVWSKTSCQSSFLTLAAMQPLLAAP